MNEPRFTAAEREMVLAAPDPLKRFLTVWVVVLTRHGISLEDDNISIAPWDYSLHRDDCTWAVEQIMALEPDDNAKALWAMEWANRGPSYYEGDAP